MLKKLFVSSVAVCVLSHSAYARDTVGSYSVSEAIEVGKVKSGLGTAIKFYFGEQPHANVVKSFGEFKTNKKTNAFGKSDKEACQWAFMSTLLALQERAIREGGNAVINIKSNYKNELTSSNNSFQCGAGALMAGVALVGTVVKIDE